MFTQFFSPYNELLRFTFLAIEDLLRLRIQPLLEFYFFIIIKTWVQSWLFSVFCLQKMSLFIVVKEGLWLSHVVLKW